MRQYDKHAFERLQSERFFRGVWGYDTGRKERKKRRLLQHTVREAAGEARHLQEMLREAVRFLHRSRILADSSGRAETTKMS